MQKTRKLISMLLAVMMVLSMCTVGMVSAYALPEDAVINDTEGNDASSIDGELYGLMGDADANGTINVKDATQIQKYAAKLITLDETSEALADVNLDGKVNVKDATAIQKWVAKFDVEEPINCLVYIPAVEPTTVATEPTTAASEDEPTTAATVDKTEPTTSVIVVPTTVATEPTEAPSTEAKPTEATEPKPTEGTDPKATEDTDPKVTDAPEDVTIYFQNNWLWSDVSVHMWSADGDITTWPGTAMNFVENDGTYDIYSVVVPDNAVGLLFNGIKDDGTGTLDQTPDILDWHNGQCFYNEWDSSLNEGAGGNAVGSFEYVVPTVPTTVVTQPATSATQDETDAQEPTTEVEEFEDSNVFLRGTLSDWDNGIAFKKTADENVVQLTIDLAAGTYEFKLVVDGTWYGNSSEFEDECENWGFRVKEKESEEDTKNCKIIATGGTYTFTVGLAEFGNSPAVLRLTVVKAEVEEPTTDAQEPTTDAEEPTTDAEEPTTDAEEPTTDAEEPTTEAKDDTVTIYLKSSGSDTDWVLNSTDRVVTMLDLDTQADYTFTLGADGWYAEVPATVQNVRFHRVKEGSISHTWNASVRGEDVNFFITGDSTGHWENEDMSKYADVYLPGDFNGWDQGAYFLKTDDADVVTKTLELAEGTYTFKVMEGSTWLGNDGEINDTTTTSSAGGWTMEEGKGNCTLIASGGTYTFNFNTSTNRLIILFNADVEEPTTEVEEPTTEVEEPTTEVEEPTTEVEEPTTEVEEPTTEVEEPTTEVEEPTTPVAKTETITFKDGTAQGWIGDQSASVYVYDYSTKTLYLGTMVDENTWTIEVPEGLTTIHFYRADPDITCDPEGEKNVGYWNCWTDNVPARDVETQNTYTATGSSSGSWNRAGSDEKIGAKVYLPGSFNDWNTSAEQFYFNAEGDTICYVELNLAANSTYTFKVITYSDTNEMEWRGLKDIGTITSSVSDVTCSRSAGDATIQTASAGKYIFAYDTANYKLSITFPD